MIPSTSRIDAFVTYAHEDEVWRVRLVRLLEQHFQAASHSQVELWTDKKLRPGVRWDDEIHQALERSRFGLALCTPAFFGRDYIQKVELTHFFDRAKTLIPVAVRPVSFKYHDLKGLDAHQFFHLETAMGRRKTFSECSTSERERFAHDLFIRIQEAIKAGIA